MLAGFRAEHGKDPIDLDERDERWLRYKAGVVTGFMRRVRSEMEAVGRERGKRVDVGACVLGKEEDNLYFAMDIPAWVKEGLIDTLIPYSPAPLAMPVATDTWASADQIEPFVKAVEGSQVVMAANIMPRQMSPEEFRRNASMLYGAGVENLFFWDCEGPLQLQADVERAAASGARGGDRGVEGVRGVRPGRSADPAAHAGRLAHGRHSAGIARR